MISVNNLVYRYPSKKEDSIRDISFTVNKGEIFGFLGPSGAGKSTTQKILIGILKGYKGSVMIDGRELKSLDSSYYERIGVGFEFPNFYQKFSGLENLKFFSRLYENATQDLMPLLESVGLEEAANVKFGNYSKGMKMRLNFCRVLLNNPDIMFLDEPASGLDPVNAKKLRELIQAEKDKGKTIIITTHNMLTAEELCDRVAFIVDGKISLIDSPKHLKVANGKKELNVEYRDRESVKNEGFSLQRLDENARFQEILKEYEIITMHTKEATLEDIFIQTTGRKLI
ncbi:ABC transporter ATP-binding protein [Niallia circulans]|jgi:fluoroquinolone transport system ATP-binding protein|uniref:ABC transporter ATP-binding protein n=1 Tax=Niallia circulans TaxID=1397 RepID=A0AA91YZG7_NIACI|nr:ABC transporter ATP-binding protein [Niallia circulans]PAD81564.1 ABC transporter ATP-binding protein [Niallia circulans]UQZ76910.1 ABC transporter ATP-binding protein [Niallia circulans]